MTFDISNLMLQHANGRPLREILIEAHTTGQETAERRTRPVPITWDNEYGFPTPINPARDDESEAGCTRDDESSDAVKDRIRAGTPRYADGESYDAVADIRALRDDTISTCGYVGCNCPNHVPCGCGTDNCQE